MDVILGDRTLDDFHIFGLAYLSQKIPQTFCHLSIEHLLSVLRNPHQVVLEVIHRMRSCPVILHLPILLKSSPKRRGVFSPRETLNEMMSLRKTSGHDESLHLWVIGDCNMERVTPVRLGQGTYNGKAGLFVEEGVAYDECRATPFWLVT